MDSNLDTAWRPLLTQPLRCFVNTQYSSPEPRAGQALRLTCTCEWQQPLNPPKRRHLLKCTTSTQTRGSLSPRSYPAGLSRRGWSIPTSASRSWSAMRTVTRRPRRGASRSSPMLPTMMSSSWALKHRPSRTFLGRARTHDRTPRVRHHNTNRARRRIGVAMSTWSLCRSPQARWQQSQVRSVSPQKTTGRLVSNITHGLIAPSRVTQTFFSR